MQREDIYLYDIVEAADAIARLIARTSSHQFADDDLTSSAVLQKLSVIGEAAARLSEDFRARKAGVPWREIIPFRNIAVHAYFAVDWQMVWRHRNRRCAVAKSGDRRAFEARLPRDLLAPTFALTAIAQRIATYDRVN